MNFVNLLIFLTTPKSLRAVNLTPTLILTVILSCRLVLNLRGSHAHPGTSAPSSGFTSNSNTKARANILKPSPYAPKSEWMDISTPDSSYQLQSKLEPNRPENFADV
jgi:hypothetical protein